MSTNLLQDLQTTPLYRDPSAGVQIELVQGFPEIIEPLLQQTVWGSGDVLYKVDDMASSLRKLPSAKYLLLKKDSELVAMHFILPKGNYFYSSILIVNPKCQGSGYGKLLKQQSLQFIAKQGGPKWMNYAYIEDSNIRSINISKALGVQPAGLFHAMTISRLFPKNSPKVSRLSEAQEPVIRQLLADRYAEHALADFDLSLKADRYWVLLRDNRIVAGVQADPQRWEIKSLAGASGWVAMHTIPYLPVIRGLFNPRDFRFLKIGNLYFQPGHAREAHELIQAVLARHQLQTSLGYFDKSSPIYEELAAAGRFGLLNALTETPVRIMALFEGFEETEIADFKRRPKVISPSDI